MKSIIDSINKMLLSPKLPVDDQDNLMNIVYTAREVYNNKTSRPNINLMQWADVLKLPTHFQKQNVVFTRTKEEFVNWSTNKNVEEKIIRHEQIPNYNNGSLLSKIVKNRKLIHDLFHYLGGILVHSTQSERKNFYDTFNAKDLTIFVQLMIYFGELPSSKNPLLKERQIELREMLENDIEFLGTIIPVTIRRVEHTNESNQPPRRFQWENAHSIFKNRFKKGTTVSAQDEDEKGLDNKL